MKKSTVLFLLTLISGCSLQELKTEDLIQNIHSPSIEERQIKSSNYCTMGFINPEIKRYKYYDEDDEHFKSYDVYKLKKCVLVHANDKLIILPRKGSKIQSPEIITININDLDGIGLYATGKYRQIQLKAQDKTIVLELLKTSGFPDNESASTLFNLLRAAGTSVFDIDEMALPVPPDWGYINW